MPIYQNSDYEGPPFYLFNGHLETILPSIFIKEKDNQFFRRERIELEDGDFLDLDWLQRGNKRCMILTHGLEGSSHRYYIQRAAGYFALQGWDILAWNCRSCSGEMNRLPRFYHHGDTADLDVVVKRTLDQGYAQVVLSGFSMGGSMSLKYLGEQMRDPRLVGAVTFSVPCSLRDSAEQLRKPANRIYEKRFLEKLLAKIQEKAKIHSEVDVEGLSEITDFDTFHDRYTAPLHGFESKEVFFQKATCDQFLPTVSVPVLIVNAINDPMLGDACYPVELVRESKCVFLEMPKKGGHVGFTYHNRSYSYMEQTANRFLNEKVI